jgi:hypothetical protein
MTEFREWDWPPYSERHGARRHGYRSGPDRSQPVLDLHVQVAAAGDRKRSLYDRILAGYLGALRIVAGASGRGRHSRGDLGHRHDNPGRGAVARYTCA